MVCEHPKVYSCGHTSIYEQPVICFCGKIDPREHVTYPCSLCWEPPKPEKTRDRTGCISGGPDDGRLGQDRCVDTAYSSTLTFEAGKADLQDKDMTDP